MSDLNEDFYDEDDDDLYMDEEFVRNGGCDCEFCEAQRELLLASDADKDDVRNRPKDFVNGILEEEQIRHKFGIDRQKSTDERIKLAMSFIEQQGVSSVVVSNTDSHRIEETKLAKVERERAVAAVFNYITAEFTKKVK